MKKIISILFLVAILCMATSGIENQKQLIDQFVQNSVYVRDQYGNIFLLSQNGHVTFIPTGEVLETDLKQKCACVYIKPYKK